MEKCPLVQQDKAVQSDPIITHPLAPPSLFPHQETFIIMPLRNKILNCPEDCAHLQAQECSGLDLHNIKDVGDLYYATLVLS